MGLPARGEILSPLLDDLISELAIKKGPAVPDSVMARQIDKNHILYLNISNKPRKIELKGRLRSLLFDKDYTNEFTIEPFEPDFIEVK
jgi:beta-galactosidase